MGSTEWRATLRYNVMIHKRGLLQKDVDLCYILKGGVKQTYPRLGFMPSLRI